MNMVCFSIALGMNGALDTLISQAYGNKQYYLSGCFLNRGRIMQFIFFIIETIILLFTKEILIGLGQEEATAGAAQQYIITLLPGLFAMTQFETVRRYLQAMDIFYVGMYIGIVTTVLHVLWSFIFVIQLEMGVTGASLSTCITYWLNLIIITVYISFKSDVVEPSSWHFFNKDSFKGWSEYLTYGLPSAFMLCCEWWAFEVLALFAGLLSVNELAANVILFNIFMFLFMVPHGISNATCTLVGNSLGEGKPETSKKFVYTSLITITFLTLLLISAMVIFRNPVAYIYTQKEEVVELITHIIPLFSVMMFFDNFQGVARGSITAIGYQKYGSMIAMNYWIFSIPFSYILTFHFDLRLQGIWLGTPVGSVVVSILFAVIIMRLDWNKVAEESKERLERDQLELSEETDLNEPLLKN